MKSCSAEATTLAPESFRDLPPAEDFDGQHQNDLPDGWRAVTPDTATEPRDAQDEPAAIPNAARPDQRALQPLLLHAGLIDQSQIDEAIREARSTGTTALQVLLDREQVSETALAEAYSKWLSIPRVELDQVAIDPEAIKSIPEHIARRHMCMPVKVEKRSLSLAMGDPSDFKAIQELQFASGLQVRPMAATRTEILAAIDRYYASDARLRDLLAGLSGASGLSFITSEAGVVLDPESTRAASELPPVIQLCNGLMLDAAKSGASDIHVEPEQNQVVVRYRIDGTLRDYMRLPKWLQDPVTVRLKILADLDIAERRLPQDGRIKAHFRGNPIDIRVSTLKTHFGEKVVLRFLGTQEIPNFRGMGLSDAQIRLLEDALGQPQGMILVTGPTGSGKTTTLYSMITRRRTPEENIITVEDPIEYQIEGVNQVQVHTKAGLTFAKTLRSILRQDPDVIMVGEIRDLETAEIAFRAAMTGHLVLSTVHTNGAAATITRLLDIGVDPVLVAGSLQLVVAQRLVRRVCVRCKVPYVPEENVLDRLRLASNSMTFYKGQGCEDCGHTGFYGRIGIWEMLPMGATLKPLVMRRASETEIHAAGEACGMHTLLDQAIERIRHGITSPDEVCRVVRTEFESLIPCASCGAKVESRFAGCPYCMTPLRSNCTSCSMVLKPDWKMCPQCMTPRHGGPIPPQLKS